MFNRRWCVSVNCKGSTTELEKENPDAIYIVTCNGAVCYGTKIKIRVLAGQYASTNGAALRNFSCAHAASNSRVGLFFCNGAHCTHTVSCTRMPYEQSTNPPNFLPMANQIWRRVRVLLWFCEMMNQSFHLWRDQRYESVMARYWFHIISILVIVTSIII